MSDKKKKSDEWVSLTADGVETYQTKEFEEASFISGDDDFKAFEISSENDDFTPIVESQDFDGFDDEREKALKDTDDILPESEKLKKGEEKKEEKNPKESKIDAFALVVEQEKEQARKEGYEKGLEEGIKKGEQEALKKFEQENKSAREEAEKSGFEEGKTKGYEEGKEEAFKEVRKEFDEKNEMVAEVLESIDGAWGSILKKYEDHIAELALSMAKKVLYSNLTLDPDFVKLSIKEALMELPDPFEVTIGVNPDDYNIIEMIKEDFFNRFENLKNVTIISDPAIGRGGCTIDSETGGITQTIENRLRDLEDALAKNGLKKSQMG